MRISRLSAGLLLVASALASVVAGCGNNSSAVDSGTDSGARDAGTEPDAQMDEDAGPGDAGPGDAGAGDSGPVDGGGPPIDTTPRRVEVSAVGHDRFFDVAIDGDQNIYAIGQVADSTEASADFRTVVARFDADGAIDTTWGTAGFAAHNLAVGAGGEVGRSIGVQSTGRVVGVATIEHAGAADARERDLVVFRLDAMGGLDATFGDGGVRLLDLAGSVELGSGSSAIFVTDHVWGLAVDSMDRVVLHGSRMRADMSGRDLVVVRLTAGGALDPAFSGDGVFALELGGQREEPKGVMIAAGDSIVAGGYYRDASAPTVVVPVVYRLTSAGVLDTSFAGGGVFSEGLLASVTEVYAVAQQGARFVTAGYGTNTAGGATDWISIGIGADGLLDESYGTDGSTVVDFATLTDNARDLVVTPDGHVAIVGAGRLGDAPGQRDAAIVMLDAMGDVDTTFGTGGRVTMDFGGTNDMLWAVALGEDRFVAVGERSTVMGEDDDAMLVIRPLP